MNIFVCKVLHKNRKLIEVEVEFDSEINGMFTLWTYDDESTPKKSASEDVANVENSVLTFLFFNLQCIHKSVNLYTHPHTNICRHKHQYTHPQWTHTQPNSTLLMCEMSKGLISWKHTTEPEEKERGRHTAGEEGGENEGKGEGEIDWEKKRRGVTWSACWWLES